MQLIRRVIICLAILFLASSPYTWGRKSSGLNGLPNADHRAVLQKIFELADEQQRQRWHYKAKYYFRSNLDLTRRNIFVLFAYNRQYYVKGGRHIFTEDYGDAEYFSVPFDQYPRKIRCTYSVNGEDVPRGFLMEYFNTNIYSRMLQNGRFLSPLDRHNAANYYYHVDSIKKSVIYFSYKARRKNSQLVSGNFAYDSGSRSIATFRFRGSYNLFVFDQTIYMGKLGYARFFPYKMTMDYRFLYYGTVINGAALTTTRCTFIEPHYRVPDRRRSKHDHNITSMFRLLCDTAAVEQSKEKMERYRTVPLTHEEDSIFYHNADTLGSGLSGWIETSKWGKKRAARKAREAAAQDSLLAVRHALLHSGADVGELPDSLSPVEITPPGDYDDDNHAGKAVVKTLEQMSEYLFRTNKFKTSPRGSFEIGSTDLSYSSGDGVRWRQDFRFIHNYNNGRQLNIDAQAAYSFGRKQMVGLVRGDYLMKPNRDFHLIVESGARNLSYNPLDAYKFDDVVTDSLGNSKGVTFVDAYVDLSASREIYPGLHLNLGIGWHQKMPLHYSREELRDMNIRTRYTSMAPHITLTYTPCERYYWRNNRKIVVYSNKPTYMLNYERAIKGAFGGTSQYERWEAMITHDMPVSPTMRLVWKVGGGMFTQRAHNDFIEYEYFNNSYMGFNWHDSRSGVFHLLDYKYYNQSNHYLRGHATLESPTLLLRCINTYFLNAERIYGSILFADGVVPYVELGYGLSTKWVDVSYFVSYLKEQGFKGGLRFNLHIFD